MSREPNKDRHDFVSPLLDGELTIANFEEFLESWRSHAAIYDSEESAKVHLKALNLSSQRALSKLIEPPSGVTDDVRVSDMFGAIGTSAIIADSMGILHFANRKANEDFGLGVGSALDDARITLLGSNEKPIVTTSLFETASKPYDLDLVRYRTRENQFGVLATMLLDTAGDQSRRWLIVFLDTPWSAEAHELLMEKFDLTETEREIAKCFAAGIPLKEIASDRGRSYVTVRHQFQSILKKTGCPSQQSLLRLLFGTNYLFASINLLSHAQDRSMGKAIEFARPRGRFVDVRLYGDPVGQPIIWLPSIFGFPVTPTINAMLVERKQLMIGIGCPGLGKSSPHPKGTDVNVCLADDISAILDSLEIDNCVFTGRGGACHALFKLNQLIPDRISATFSINSLLPHPYVNQNEISSQYARALLIASKYAPPVASLILGGGTRLVYRDGVRAVFGKAYQKSPCDVEITEDPDVAASVQDGIRFMTRQGLRAAVQAVVDSFGDWRHEVADITKQVTLIHGRTDPQSPISACRSFQADFPDVITLEEVHDGGGLLNYTHTGQILDRLAQPHPPKLPQE